MMRRLLPLLLVLPLLALDCGDAVEPPQPALTTISVAPALDTIESIGATVTLAATALDQDGDPFSGATVTWSSSAASVATVNGAGVVTAVVNGSTTITAASGTVQGSATVVVHQKATALAITTPPGGGAAGADFPTQPVVQLRDAGGATVTHDDETTVTASVTGVTLTGTTTVTAVDGVATFTNLAITEPGTHTVTFSTAGLPSVTAPVTLTNDAEFLISAAGTEEDIGAAAFDGTNYVVVWKTESGTGHSLQRVSQTGTLVGTTIPITGATGDPPRVACDGTRCLVTWAHNNQANGTWSVRGVFVKADGTLDGDSFEISPPTGSGVLGAPNLEFGGGTYMVDYLAGPSHDDPDLSRFVRTISPTGTVGAEVPVVTNVSEGFGGFAYGGGVFVASYRTSAGVVGAKTITPAGVVGSHIEIAAAGEYETAVPVAFDGTNFLVVFNRRETGTGAEDIWVLGRRLSTAGATIGSEFAIDTQDGAPRTVGMLAQPLGSGRVVVSLMHEDPDAGTVVMAMRFVTFGSGAPTVSGATTLAALAEGKVALGGIFATTSTTMLANILRGTPGSNPENPLDGWTDVDLYGRVIPIP